MKIRDYLTKEDIQGFTAKSDFHAATMLGVNWLGIIAIFCMVYVWTNPLTIILAIILLAGRQLGLAVIMHDCGHRTFFKTTAINPFVGQWLAAAPIFSELDSFAANHLIHHQTAGTHDDPDLVNYQNYPVSRQSFKRKMIRDLSGQTGFKLMRFVFQSALGVLRAETRAYSIPFLKMLLAQLGLIIVLALTLSPWLYLLWFGAIVTSYMLVVRIRQIAEHAAVPDLYDLDPRNNSRTTIPSVIERMLIAPNYVNYHLEHHFMASVPCYRLKALHDFLKEKGAYDDTRLYQGYREVVEHALSGSAA